MSGTTISGVYLTGVTLSNAATQNPATVSAGATITTSGTALVGTAGTYWTVENESVVSGAIGISLASGGDVINHDAIAGTTHGILLGLGGAVTNTAGALIRGSYGIESLFGPLSVLNEGVILFGQNEDRTRSPDGIYSYGFAVITNTASGEIFSQVGTDATNSVGVYIQSGSLVNAGKIFGNEAGASLGDAYLYNASSGVIGITHRYDNFGPSYYAETGVVFTKEGASAINAGTIAGVTEGIHLTKGGSVSNTVSGIIRGANMA